MLPTISQNLTLQEAIETATQINKDLKRRELDGVFCKKLKLLIRHFLHFLAKRRKTREEKWGHQTRLLNPGKAIVMAICPIIFQFIT